MKGAIEFGDGEKLVCDFDKECPIPEWWNKVFEKQNWGDKMRQSFNDNLDKKIEVA